MKILVTSPISFIGKNLIAELKCRDFDIAVLSLNDDLTNYTNEYDVIYHLETVYRSQNEEDFNEINVNYTKKLIDSLKWKKFIYISSTQAGNNTPYGDSKKKAEDIVLSYNNTGVLRLSGEFGKWCEPFTNSVVATFCHQIATGKEITINDPNAPLNLVYIDDIVVKLISMINEIGVKYVEPEYNLTVGELADILRGFYEDRKRSDISDIENLLIKKLYSTYLTYLPKDDFGCDLIKHSDDRGSFTELLHFGGKGQVSINVSKPGIMKGNHWHNTKTEKFIVVSGKASIKFRKVDSDEIIEYIVTGDNPQSIDIPPGFTHSITNIGEEDLVTVMWANEIFDPNVSDTYFLEVEK